MPSTSFHRWATERVEALDEIEGAHAQVGGSERGRRYATQQINYAYAALLSSHFQGFCRDLHSECVEHVVGIVPSPIQDYVRAAFRWSRSLARGNPSPGAIGSDFGRLGIDFWLEVDAQDVRNPRRRELLQELLAWRNAIVHQDFETVAPAGDTALHLAKVRAWRSALGALARDFDRAMYNHLRAKTGLEPW